MEGTVIEGNNPYKILLFLVYSMATSSSKSILSSKDSIGNQDSRATCKFRKWTTENTLGEDIEGKSPKNCQSFSLF